MKIIELKVNDINIYKNDIILLLKQTIEKSFPQKDYSNDYFEERVKTLMEYIKHGMATVYASKLENQIIGLIWFFEKSTETIHINHFVVNQQYRGSGIGKKLWNKMEDYAQNQKVSNIELLVTNNNDSAVNFYKDRNFKVERLVMKKRLL